MLEYDDAILEDDRAELAPHRRALVDRIEPVLNASDGTASRIVRVKLPVETVDPLAWLRVQPQAQKLYWAGRQSEKAVAGVGMADVLTGNGASVDFEQLQVEFGARWQQADDAQLRYFGGLRFDDQSPAEDERWADFCTYQFVLPRFELRTDGQTATLACNLVLPQDAHRHAELRAAIDALAWPAVSAPDPLPRSAARTDAPDRPAWIEMVEWALRSIEAGRLDKVVLARRTTFDFLDPLDPLAVLQHLQAATPGCFHFGMQPAAGRAFIGASPERLFWQTGRKIRTEAIAGTRSRGESDQADAALREELLASEKDRREHAYVQDAIRAALEPITARLELNQPPSEMRLARGRHLRSRLEGRLCEGISPLDVLQALHPTPAVGGVPACEAQRAIRAREPFDRGWYAGPIGWIESDAAEFAVALRCGLVRDGHLDLFSGAGIVEGSVPEREWEEIEQKISDFAAVLELNA